MGDKTAIEWCDATFNPWWGCTRISPACDHCYADTWARRTGHALWDNGQRRTFGEKHWIEPLKWARTLPAKLGRRPRVFCASMADVFDKDAPEGARERLWTLIDETPEIDWLLLTKRIGNAAKVQPQGFLRWPHVWIGATIANQEEADRDIPKLLSVPAHRRFLSCEPLLGPIDLTAHCPPHHAPHLRADRIGWVISGGESGPNARPSHPDWHRSLRDQCAAAGVPFLFKQWGEWLPISEQREDFTDRLYRSNRVAKLHEDQGAIDECYGRRCLVPHAVVQHDGSVRSTSEPGAFQQGTAAMMTFKVGKKAAGRVLDGRTHDEFPERTA